MAGALNFRLEIQGLDQSISKLRELSRLIQSITSNASKLGQIGNTLQNATSRGRGFAPVIVNRGGALEGAAGGAVVSRAYSNRHRHPDSFVWFPGKPPDTEADKALGGRNINGTLHAVQNRKQAAIDAYKNLRTNTLLDNRGRRAAKRLFDKTNWLQLIDLHGHDPMGMMEIFQSGRAGTDFQKMMEHIRPMQLANAITHFTQMRKNNPMELLDLNFSNVARLHDRKYEMQRAVDVRREIRARTMQEQKLTAPFIGNKFAHAFKMAGMNEKTGKYKEGGIDKIMGAFSGGGGGFGGIIKGGLGEAGAAFAGFLQPIALLTLGLAAAAGAVVLLHKAIELMLEGVKRGADAFHSGARTGQTVGSQVQQAFAAQAVGLDPNALDSMALKAQFGGTKVTRARIPGVNSDAAEMLGMAKSGEFGNMQQMLNQSKEFEAAWQDAAKNALEVENSSKALAQTQVSMLAVSREWNTLWQQIATVFSPAIKLVMTGVKVLLDDLNEKFFLIIKAMQFLHLVPKGGPGTDKYPGSSGKTLAGTATSWEKLGLVFGASKKDHLADISANTRKTAESLIKMVEQTTRGTGKFNNNTPITSMP